MKIYKKKLNELNITNEIIKYLIAGVMTTIVSLGVYYFSVNAFLNATNTIQLQIANIFSWISAVGFAYFMNRKFVFRSKSSNIFCEIGLFYFSRITTLLLDMLGMFVFVSILKYDNTIVKLVLQFIITLSNYILSKVVVFKKVV